MSISLGLKMTMKIKFLFAVLAVALNFEFSSCQYGSSTQQVANQAALPVYSQVKTKTYQQPQTEQQVTYTRESVQQPLGVSETFSKTITQPVITQPSYSNYGQSYNGGFGKRMKRSSAE